MKRLGGLTNYMYNVSSNLEGHSFNVVIRLFGTSSGIFSNRTRENICYKVLEKQNITPKMIFVNDKLRVEELVDD